jgi:glutamate---cysteine ligase / carboxylate-amine ligase
MHQTLMTPTAADFTIGVEEEYQIVDPATGALRSSASEIRSGDWTGELLPELQETTVEIGTPICTSARAAGDELQRLRFQAATVAQARDLTIVAAGLHPFAGWEGHRRPDLARYRSIEHRYGRIARDEHIFGMHIHVAVPEHIERIALMNVLRHYLPHLLALAASSPFYEGADTGFASYRSIIWRRWPNSGIPPRFESDDEYNRFIDVLLDSGSIADTGNLYWSMRSHSKYPTIEFRVTDACPSMTDAVAIAALARTLVYAAAMGVLVDTSREEISTTLEQETLRVNEWRAARDGLSARLIDTTHLRGHQPMRSEISRLIDRIARCADDLGETDSLAGIERIVERGNAANRMRMLYAETDSMESLVDWLADETLLGTGLDRRNAQRE